MNLLTLPQDRDYTPYAYPALMHTRYLEAGHIDIKPPLIHWAYILWIRCLEFFSLIFRFRIPLTVQLRSMPLAGAILSVSCLTISGHGQAAVVLGLLLLSPTLWPHMANTEWMSVCLIALCLFLPPWIQWVSLGLLPWVNQKNALLVLPLAWALHLHPSWDCLLVFGPAVIILSYLYATDRLVVFVHWCWLVPAAFGHRRTLKKNTLVVAKILIPCIALLAPFIAVGGLDRWELVSFCVVIVMFLTKQIVPHHFILLALPVALSAHPVALTWIAFLLVWLPRDGMCWWKPSLTYIFTFSTGGGDYGALMADVKKIERYIIEHTTPEQNIWVNGMENQIYLNCMRRAWRVDIPELTLFPDEADYGASPKFIVHCLASSKPFDYAGYEPVMVSTSGQFTLLEKQYGVQRS